MPIQPRGASYNTSIVKASSEANGSIGGAVARGGNSATPTPAGTLSSIVNNNFFAQILFRELDNMPGPPGPPGPTGPAGSGGSFAAIGADIWGGSPPTTTEEAINRIATLLYTRTFTQGPLSPVPNNTRIFTIRNAGASDIFVVKYNSTGTPQWVRRISGSSQEIGVGISSDSSGNVYVTGYHTTTATVFAADGITAAFTLGNAVGYDAFVVKYNTSGTLQWVRKIGGAGGGIGFGISTDSSNNVYVIGYNGASSSVFAADGTTSVFSLANSGNIDAFVVKYNTDGTPQWVRRIGGTGEDAAMSISVGSSGNVYVSGYHTGTATVFAADGTTTAFSLGNAGGSDAFVVKYASDGTPSWVRRIGGAGNDQGLGIASDSSGNVYVTGYHAGTATVFAADGTTTAFSLGNAGSTDAFVVKYDTDGTPSWVRRIGGAGLDQGLSISAMSTGEVYITGYGGTATVFAADGITSSFSPATSLGNDAFVVKYASDGTPSWVRRIGGAGNDRGLGITSDSSGNVYVTGFADGTATVFAADGTAIAFSLGNAGSNDAFIVKYSTDGTPQWVTTIGGSGGDTGQGIASDLSNNVYVTGSYNSTIIVRSPGL